MAGEILYRSTFYGNGTARLDSHIMPGRTARRCHARFSSHLLRYPAFVGWTGLVTDCQLIQSSCVETVTPTSDLPVHMSWAYLYPTSPTTLVVLAKFIFPLIIMAGPEQLVLHVILCVSGDQIDSARDVDT